LLIKYWNWVSERGVSNKHQEENALIRLFNQMSLITTIVISSVSFIAYLLNYNLAYISITACASLIYCSAIFLNHSGKIYTSRLVVALGTAIWPCLAHLCFGGYFSQSLIICANVCVTFISFASRPRQRDFIIASTVATFFSTVLYVQLQAPILGIIEYPFDELITLFVAGFWVIAVLQNYTAERERLIKDLQQKNVKLEQTTEELERFTYIASHDLKSPLRTINSFIGLIERDITKGNYEALNDRLKFVKSGAQQMNSLIADILEISTLKDPEAKKKTTVDLNKVLQKVQVNLTEELISQNAIVHADILPSYYCDEAEFSLLFQNMIQNGIKYNNSKTPTVNISSQTIGNQLSISFQDNGIGIEKKYHNQIFQYFKRLHTSDKYEGTGLGLGLCKKIVNSYNGDIEVESETGVGSIFRIKLQVSK